jgi:hypothetical protein
VRFSAGDMDGVKQGLLSKDLLEKLKRVEKLSQTRPRTVDSGFSPVNVTLTPISPTIWILSEIECLRQLLPVCPSSARDRRRVRSPF